MSDKEFVSDLLFEDPGLLFVCWDREKGWWLQGKGCQELCHTPLEERGATGLVDMVQEDESFFCKRFLEKLQGVLAGKNQDLLKEKNFQVIFLHLKTAESIYRQYKLMLFGEQNDSGTVDRVLLLVREATAQERYRLELSQKITNDKNPAYFLDGTYEIMNRHPDWKYALIQFDVAKFKMINEIYGEDFGDELLRFFIHELKTLCSKEQLYARLTADVFMILTPYETQQDILDFIDKLDYNLTGYKDVAYTLYYGVCKVSDRNQKLRKYGDGAAFARQSIKGNAREHIAFYRQDMKEKAKIRKYIEDYMEEALRNQEFLMYLQPKYSISRNELLGAEALVRWKTKEFGMIPPNEFIPIFEQNGFVISLDEYIWEQACKAIHKWKQNGQKVLPISVNMSRKHLIQSRYRQVLNGLIEKYQIDKRYLEIELTETVDEQSVAEAMNCLKEEGYTLLMDDFGSGYSSLNTLKDTKFDVIKIDRFFLQNLIDSERGKKIVEHTIHMTKDIGLDMIAEGVETKEQAQFLCECGCDKAQGFYYAKPMPLTEFEKLLK